MEVYEEPELCVCQECGETFWSKVYQDIPQDNICETYFANLIYSEDKENV